MGVIGSGGHRGFVGGRVLAQGHAAAGGTAVLPGTRANGCEGTMMATFDHTLDQCLDRLSLRALVV